MHSVSADWGNGNVYMKVRATNICTAHSFQQSFLEDVSHMDPSKKKKTQQIKQTLEERDCYVVFQKSLREMLWPGVIGCETQHLGQRRSKPETNKSLLSKPTCGCSVQNCVFWHILSFKPWLTHRKWLTL